MPMGAVKAPTGTLTAPAAAKQQCGEIWLEQLMHHSLATHMLSQVLQK